MARACGRCEAEHGTHLFRLFCGLELAAVIRRRRGRGRLLRLDGSKALLLLLLILLLLLLQELLVLLLTVVSHLMLRGQPLLLPLLTSSH